jgi:hypothetical protein
MIYLLKAHKRGQCELFLEISDGTRSCECMLFFEDSDIPRITWDSTFEKQFEGRFSVATPILSAAMEAFSANTEICIAGIPGELRESLDPQANH